MSKEKNIYPLKFQQLVEDRNWGKEIILLSDLEDDSTKVSNGWLEDNNLDDIMDTYFDKIIGENLYNFFGRQFPVQIKILDIVSNYGLRVCPSDVIAQTRYDSLGKKKLWYILSSSVDAKIYLGFKHDISASNFYTNCLNGEILDNMNVLLPNEGDVVEINPGLIHGTEGKLKILEISESSDVEFCIYEYGKDPELCQDALISAIDFVDLSKYSAVRSASNCSSEHDCHCHGEHCGEHEHDCHCHGEHCGEHEHDCHCHGEHCHDDECSCEHHHDSYKDKYTEILSASAEFTTTKLTIKDPVHIYTEKFESFIVYFALKGETQLLFPATKQDYKIKPGEIILIPSDCQDFIIQSLEDESIVIEVILDNRDVEDPYLSKENDDMEEIDDDDDILN